MARLPAIDVSKILLIAFAIFSAFFLGLVSLIFVNMIGDHYIFLVTLPVAFLLCLLFIFDRYLFLSLVIITRASLDPVFDAVKLGSFGLGAVMNAFVILIAILMFFKNPKRQSLQIQPINVSWAIFLILAFLSIAYSPIKLTSIKVSLQFVSYAAMFYIGVMLVQSHHDFGKWLRAVIYSSVIPVLYGAFCMLFETKFGYFGYRMYLGEGMRLLSTTNHPACFSFYLVLIITVCFYVYKTKADFINPMVMRALPFYILLLLGFLLMTKSRAGWAVCGFYFVLYGAIFERRYLLYLFVASLLMLLIPDVQYRLMDLTKGNEIGYTGYERLNSFAWRLKYWSDSLGWMAKSHYLFGYGVSSFVHFSTDFGMGNAFEKQTTELPAHSVYVQTFFELGIFGVLAFISIMVTTVMALFKVYQRQKLLIFTALVIMFEYLIAGASDNLLDYLNYIWYHWFVIGLIIGYAKLHTDLKPTFKQ